MKLHEKFRIPVLIALVALSFTCASVASTPVKVMTYNVDEGTDFTAIIGVFNNPSATAADFVAAVHATEIEVQNSQPLVRMGLVAGEIATAQPDLVGLQEVAVWNLPNGQIDFLKLILANLPNYKAVLTVPEFQINIPGLVGFMDREVILARTDEPALQVITTGQGHYSAQIPLPAFPPLNLPASSITRGWGYVNARMNSTPFRFITTHLEDGTNPISPLFALVQALQEIQLVYSPASTFLPVIIGGDFNTVANDPSNPTFVTYRFMLANGFSDAWSTASLRIPDATCCQEDLTISASELTQRLDQIFMRNRVTPAGAQLVGAGLAENAFWPSDHAAVYTVGNVSGIF